MEKFQCNCCGKQYTEADYVEIQKEWGYFSKKDATITRMKICEDCFDRWVAGFEYPPEKEDVIELL